MTFHPQTDFLAFTSDPYCTQFLGSLNIPVSSKANTEAFNPETLKMVLFSKLNPVTKNDFRRKKTLEN